MIELQDMAELAAKYVNTTDRHIFLTGKAGTGKTTFLKYIVDHTYKNTVVAAPTGIAAINAGGVTLHSLLQLPFGTFLPENSSYLSGGDGRVNTPQTLFRETKFNATKRKLIKELELLIIDEVSMLRADLLDCIDHTLRYLRKRQNEPFGGLQILFIGDLMQLPPVVKETEAKLLASFYPSLYFFNARALASTPPVLVELQKIFRQTDQEFIDLLNRFRHNEQTEEDLRGLNKHFQPDFDEIMSTGYIHLTTHNHRAFQINATRLQRLENEEFHFDAFVEGDFPENMTPTDKKLTLKSEAQVMFIKNDPSGEGKFFNGKIGRVSRIDEDSISVKDENGFEISVEKYTWENKRYTLSTTGEVEEKFLGSFEQYPLKLAWAVTIHKSQGLTFEKAILDLSGTFAPGQLYVALSRLTSLTYLVLSSPLPEKPPEMDESLQSFSTSFQGKEELVANLDSEKRSYLAKFARHAFDLSQLTRELTYHQRSFNKEENRSIKQQYLPWTYDFTAKVEDLKKVGDQFMNQILQITQQTDYLSHFSERIIKAHDYFIGKLTSLSDEFSGHKKNVKKDTKVKSYLKELDNLETLLSDQKRLILKTKILVDSATEDRIVTKDELRASGFYSAKKKDVVAKKDKTPTAQITYELYLKGKSIAEIAEERGYVAGTIEGHLATYVENGAIDVHDLVSKDRVEKIIATYNNGHTNSAAIKAELPNDYGYGEIKLVTSYIQSMENAN